MRKLLPFLPIFLFSVILSAQTKTGLDYYLPKVAYDPAIPTPAQFLGYEVGEWHASHDLQAAYMRELDRVSDRITIKEHGRTHEKRPLYCLFITAPENHKRLETIRQERQKLMDPAQSGNLDLRNMPAVNYMGYSIHGNEASGSNAALLVAYYLAAAQTPEVEQLLQNTVILFDPCFNPDGMQRFSSWVNSRRSQNTVTDGNADEYNETWPRGRYNHYWFDLNRDWLVAQQPESVGRVALFQDWHPNVLTDHHEMGSNNTFFFQPGVPTRVNPITPPRNQELTAKIAQYHADILSQNKVQFFSGENFDDFYYGKGSTYPDAQGCIGILFEQGSSRGSAQETENGLLTFAYSIRNQVFTSLSTLKAVREMRVELNDYLRDFYKKGLEEARRNEVKGFLFGDKNKDVPTAELLNVLRRHHIEVRTVAEDLALEGKTFKAGNTFWVPLEQTQSRLVRGIFERQTAFQDSIFYDISAWTLPDAFGVDWTPVKSKDLNNRWIGPLANKTSDTPTAALERPAYAYVLDAVGYDLPTMMARFLKDGIRLKVATKPFESGNQKFAAGSIVIPAERQTLDETALLRYLNQQTAGQTLHAIDNGLTPNGPDLGSDNFRTLRTPEVLLLTGEGVNAESAGEVWHLLDTRYGLRVTHLETGRFNRTDLNKYNVVILAEGSYGNIAAEKLRQFANDGGTVIGLGSALRFLRSTGLAPIEFRNSPAEIPGRRPYDNLEEDRAARRMPGGIFEAELDLTHPLCYGYDRPRLPMFLSDTLFVETARNPYATPAVFTASPLLAGYVHPKQKNLMGRSAAVVVCGSGRGRVICFAGDPNFRAFWYGTNRLFANAIFFGNLVSSDAVEKKGKDR